MNRAARYGRRGAALLAATALLVSTAATAAELHSVHVDRAGERILIRGSGFAPSTAFSLGGIAVPSANVTASELELPFGTEIYSAAQWEASYALVMDGAVTASVYIDGPIVGPPGPPEPPSGGPDCPCISGWSTSGIPQDNMTWCYYGQDGDQLWMYALRSNWTISMAFDPGNIFFDPVDPGNSVSYCVLLNNGSYEVAEPVTNIDQYSDCELWMWRKICI
jgi:hypothetical protein